jgi:23S rRNA (cytosine1962-C5)-methyltransferase
MLNAVFLKSGKEESLLRRHPWVFSGAISHAEGRLVEGDLVNVFASSGKFLGCGHVADGSIAVRIISFENIEIDHEFWRKKLQKALDVRKDCGIANNPSTSMYRLVHGEGDGLPGLIIDMYGSTAVIQAHSLGMHLNIDQISKALQEILGSKLKAIYDKSSETLSKIKDAETVNGFIYGEASGVEICTENDCKFNIDYVHGQKTGFFIDQRDNRALLGEYAKGKKVLNVFCYTGGFSIYALKHGALEVHSLDSSAKALELTDENVRLGGFDIDKHRSIKADAVEYLKTMEQEYDIIVLDPPAFAKRMDARHAAVQAYKRINVQAMRQLKPGGLLFTFSCSQAVDAELFRHTMTAAAIEAQREVRILHKMRQPADHPVNIFHPEGEYLKGLVLRLD